MVSAAADKGGADLRQEVEFLRTTNESLLHSLNEFIALRDASQKILTAHEASAILTLLLGHVKDLVKTDRLQILLRDEASGEFLPPSDLPGPPRPELVPDRDLIEWTLRERKPTTVPRDDGTFLTVVPLGVQQEGLGVLTVDTSHIGETLSQQVLDVLNWFGGQAAVALLNCRLFTRVESQRQLLSHTTIYLQNVLDSITNGIMSLDMQGRITRFNRNAMAMLEISQEVNEAPFAEVLPGPMVEILREMVRETHEAGFTMERQYNHQLSQGLELPLAVATSLLRDEQMNTIGLVVILRDMTASKELERLRRLDQLKSEFVANVSHELKTPLTSIKAYTEALTEMVAPEEETQKNFLKVISEESDRLLFLIQDLLNVAKIESGKLVLKPELVPPRALLEEILGISKVQSQKHKLTVVIAPDMPDVYADRERMKEVLINMISNAIKYSPKGGEVVVTMDIWEKNVRVRVKDPGIGIAKEHLQKIFEQFFRVDSSLTYEVPGTGLGLTIVKAIVEAHGGKITVESEVGVGSTFTVLFPARRELKSSDWGKAGGSAFDA